MTRRFSTAEHGGGLSKGSARANGFGGEGGGGLTRQTAQNKGGDLNSQSEKMNSRAKNQNIASLLNSNMNVDYEENLQAEIMKQKEEHEAALFKRFF